MPSIVVDFSRGSCRVGLYKARTGKVEIIKNGYGNVDTPSYVAYTDDEELPIVGEAARDQADSNPKNTVYDLQLLVGRDFSEAEAIRRRLGRPFKVCNNGGKAAVQVEIQGVTRVYSTVEITSHLFAKMRRTAEAHINGEVRDAVIMVPSDMEERHQKAVKDAAKMVGLTGAWTGEVEICKVTTVVEACVRKQPQLTPNGDVLILHWGQYTINMAVWNSSNTEPWKWEKIPLSDLEIYLGDIGDPDLRQQALVDILTAPDLDLQEGLRDKLDAIFTDIKNKLQPTSTIKKVLLFGRVLSAPGARKLLSEVLNLKENQITEWKEEEAMHSALLHEAAHLSANDPIPVFVDLETSGLSTDDVEVLQLAAKAEDRMYSVYIVPQRPIPAEATNVNGLKSESGKLYFKGNIVETQPLRIAFSGFIEFLKGLNKKVVLLAHNGIRFDFKFLLREIRKNNLLQEFSEVVAGLIDTLEVFKDKLPERKSAKKSFSQPILAADYSINNPEAHNASKDVIVLQELTVKIGVSPADLLRHVKTVAWFVRMEGLKCLMPRLTEYMISKIADAGVSLQELQTVFLRGGEAALTNLLKHDVNGKPNVTKDKRVISDIVTAVQATLANSEV